MKKAMLFVVLVLSVAGLAVAEGNKKQFSISPAPGCTCVGNNQATGKPWTASECKTACDTKRLRQSIPGADPFSNYTLTNPTFSQVSEADRKKAKDEEQQAAQSKEDIKKPLLLSLFAIVVVFLGLFLLVYYKNQGDQPYWQNTWGFSLPQLWTKKRRKRKVSDQQKLAEKNSPPPPAQPPPAPLPETRSEALTVVSRPALAVSPPQPKKEYPPEVMDLTQDPDLLGNIVYWLEKWANPNTYRWAEWGAKISMFLMHKWGWQPEIKCFAGGMEITVMEENEELCYLILLEALSFLPARLKLVVFEQRSDGMVFVLMPEESALLAVAQDGNVTTLSAGLREHFLTHGQVQQHKAIGE